MKRIILVILTLAAFFAAQAQELEVKEFRAEINNTYATSHAKVDFSGNPCGVVLLSLPDPNAEFEGDVMYDYLKYDHGEWVIYMIKGAKWLNIKTDKYAPVRYDFPNGLSVNGNVTYIMTVQVPKQMTEEEMLTYLREKGYSFARNSDEPNGNKVSNLVAKGNKYLDDKNYTEAARCYHQAADQGDAEGQYNLGLLYEIGNGVVRNFEEAMKWFRKAAEKNYAKAQIRLGLMYYYGEVPGAEEWWSEDIDFFGPETEDAKEAIKWFRKAAQQGDADGQCYLGNMYEEGDGVPRDYAEAVKWYRKAADQGNTTGQCELGGMYFMGRGVSQNYVEAMKWYSKAAERGNATAMRNIGNMYEGGHGVSKDCAEAVKWFRMAAEKGDGTSSLALGFMYYYGGDCGTEDHQEAIKWFRMAADQGSIDAQMMLDQLEEEE